MRSNQGGIFSYNGQGAYGADEGHFTRKWPTRLSVIVGSGLLYEKRKKGLDKP